MPFIYSKANKFRFQKFAGKVALVFWDRPNVILIDCMDKRKP